MEKPIPLEKNCFKDKVPDFFDWHLFYSFVNIYGIHYQKVKKKKGSDCWKKRKEKENGDNK